MKEIVLARDFSRFPAGRYRKNSKHSGQAFREEWLVPALRSKEPFYIYMDGTRGYGSSFLEEAFGGLVRIGELTKENLPNMNIISSDPTLKIEILRHIGKAFEAIQDEEAQS